MLELVDDGDDLALDEIANHGHDLALFGAHLHTHGGDSTAAARSPGSGPPATTAAQRSDVIRTARGSTSAATTSQPASSAATADDPLPTKGSQTVMPGAALPASMRLNSATGFWVG